ncbi:MAG TPA: type II toxin-antitoxin system VapB family antitoxin [Geminicoccaceae bacterium]|nr:type II toxin-antitoxin system VapB family antitoxin [Geminicoccus sp.]HMU49382.1 type II toxin-antitoxin system VapB family antitoxin [Geminicoccaceae bacterium]
MALNIKSAETDRLARELATLTGESITEAVTKALEMRLEAARHERDHLRRERVRALIDEIRERAASRPVLDKRSDEEILGYNERGTFD